MNSNVKKEKNTTSRGELIERVQTPLNFFVLVVLVVEAILGIITTVSSEKTIQASALYGMLTLIAALVIIVLFLSVIRPEALKGNRPFFHDEIDTSIHASHAVNTTNLITQDKRNLDVISTIGLKPSEVIKIAKESSHIQKSGFGSIVRTINKGE